MLTDSRQQNGVQLSLFHNFRVSRGFWDEPSAFLHPFAGSASQCARSDGHRSSPRRSMEDEPPVAAGEASVGRRRKLNPDGTYRCHSD